MNNTKRSLIFGLSLIFTTLMFTLLLTTLPRVSTKTIFYVSLYIIMPLMFFLTRKIYIDRNFNKGQIFFSLLGKTKNVNIRIILYSILLFTEYKLYNSFSNINMYLTILFFLIITEFYIFISNRSTKVYFLSQSIIVHGLDFKIDIPLNDGIKNTSGIYAYTDFDEYSIKKNIFTLHLDSKRGTISMILPEDKVPHIVAFIQSKNIKHID